MSKTKNRKKVERILSFLERNSYLNNIMEVKESDKEMLESIFEEEKLEVEEIEEIEECVKESSLEIYRKKELVEKLERIKEEDEDE